MVPCPQREANSISLRTEGEKMSWFLNCTLGKLEIFFKIPLVFVQYDIIWNVIDDIYDTN